MFFGLFKKKPPQQKNYDNVSVGSTNIRYKPELITDLKDDHKTLLDLYTDIKISSEIRDYKKTSNHLTAFRNELEDHLLKENINLYIYLTHLLKDDELNSALIGKFRKEMDGIAKAVIQFLEKYSDIENNAELQKEFSAEFANIGDVLGARIQREESMLYTLYMPPY